MGGAQRSLPMDPSSIYGAGILQSKSGLGPAGEHIVLIFTIHSFLLFLIVYYVKEIISVVLWFRL